MPIPDPGIQPTHLLTLQPKNRLNQVIGLIKPNGLLRNPLRRVLFLMVRKQRYIR